MAAVHPAWRVVTCACHADDVIRYRAGVDMLKAAGVEVYGYMHLRNISRPCCTCCGNLTQVAAWIETTKATAAFDGIMMDNLDAPWVFDSAQRVNLPECTHGHWRAGSQVLPPLGWGVLSSGMLRRRVLINH